MGDLDGRVALVTGGGKGIGRAIALQLAAAGAQVAVLGRDGAALEQTVQAIGGATLAVPCDLLQSDQIRAAYAQIQAQLGPIDLLVNNAGIAASAKLVDMDEAAWERILRVNLTAAFLCAQAALPNMIARGWGRIVNIASLAGRVGLRYAVAYTASKHGLLGLTRALALEVARHNITVNAVCPGWTDTAMLTDAVASVRAATGRSEQEALAALMGAAPINRVIAPEEVARAVLFLVAPAAGGITGQAINIDGGSVMS